MEVPTRKEVVDKLEWRSSDVVEVGSGHNLDATYEWGIRQMDCRHPRVGR